MNKNLVIIGTVVSMLMGVSVSGAFAEDSKFSEEALFVRCYGQLTRSRPRPSNPLYQKVLSGDLDAAEACRQILEESSFGSNGELANQTKESINVISTFQALHDSWFGNRGFAFNSCAGPAMEDFYDESVHGLYFTRSLFDKKAKFSDVVTYPKLLEAVRKDGDPKPIRGVVRSTVRSHYQDDNETWDIPLVTKGPIIGYRDAAPVISKKVNRDVNFTLGGGLIGTPAYMMSSVQKDRLFANGADKMPRKWIKAMFKDLLCRDLPVLRPEDTVRYLVPDSSVAFRSKTSCMRCHSTSDTAASVLRGYQVTFSGTCNAAMSKRSIGIFNPISPTLSSGEQQWPSEPDKDFYKRPSHGKLYFRNYQGRRIVQDITSVADLGQKLASHSDLYICAAKRYFEYFTGVDVRIADFESDEIKETTTDEELKYRKEIVRLGEELKKTQRLDHLILSILRSPFYIQGAPSE